jgi:hypothetical protein
MKSVPENLKRITQLRMKYCEQFLIHDSRLRICSFLISSLPFASSNTQHKDAHIKLVWMDERRILPLIVATHKKFLHFNYNRGWITIHNDEWSIFFVTINTEDESGMNNILIFRSKLCEGTSALLHAWRNALLSHQKAYSAHTLPHVWWQQTIY